WTETYERGGLADARRYMDGVRREHRIDMQVFDDAGEPLAPRRAASAEGARGGHPHLPWRRLGTEYSSPTSGRTYLVIYRMPHTQLAAWHRHTLLGPPSALRLPHLVLTPASQLL